MQKKVIVAEHIDESGIALLKQSDKVELIYFDDPVSDDVFNPAFKEASAVMVRSKKLSREMIQGATRLEIIAKHGVGVDKIGFRGRFGNSDDAGAFKKPIQSRRRS